VTSNGIISIPRKTTGTKVKIGTRKETMVISSFKLFHSTQLRMYLTKHRARHWSPLTLDQGVGEPRPPLKTVWSVEFRWSPSWIFDFPPDSMKNRVHYQVHSAPRTGITCHRGRHVTDHAYSGLAGWSPVQSTDICQHSLCCSVMVYTTTYLENRHGVWIRNWIYWTLTNRNHK
jgi:hypothetical protein